MPSTQGVCTPPPAFALHRRVARPARERDHVADVRHAGDVHDEALEAEAEAGVRHGAVPAQVEVPLQRLLLDTHLLHARLQHLELLLALRPADQLADARHQDVHGAHRLAVLAQLHVEGLDALRVVGDDDRLVEDDVRQVALVLAAEVDAPERLLVELGLLQDLRVREDLDGARVGDALKGRGDDGLQPLDEPLLDALVEELEVGGAVVEAELRAELDVVLREVHVRLEVRERDLGLDHPELGEVAAGVAVLRAEGRAESVHVAHRHRERLHLQLPRHRHVGLPAEEVAREVDLALGRDGQLGHAVVIRQHRRHPEHLARALAVRARDERRVDVQEAAALEEGVRRVGQRVAHARHGAEDDGARAQVLHLAQRLQLVELLRQRVRLGVRRAQHRRARRLQLDFLALGRRRDDVARDAQRGADGAVLEHVGEALGALDVAHHLQAVEAGAVRERHEHERVLRLLARRARPARDRHALAHGRQALVRSIKEVRQPHAAAGEQRGDGRDAHCAVRAKTKAAGRASLASTAATASTTAAATRTASGAPCASACGRRRGSIAATTAAAEQCYLAQHARERGLVHAGEEPPREVGQAGVALGCADGRREQVA
mmetsp:Transcript_19201/g.67773  ORF Transcript_19201/g.67773 Transcript_19201/m.67773 type:complete len:606 (+) Transcript_19201:86-1903(+)